MKMSSSTTTLNSHQPHERLRRLGDGCLRRCCLYHQTTFVTIGDITNYVQATISMLCFVWVIAELRIARNQDQRIEVNRREASAHPLCVKRFWQLGTLQTGESSTTTSTTRGEIANTRKTLSTISISPSTTETLTPQASPREQSYPEENAKKTTKLQVTEHPMAT